ncbi:MAG: hypothetical protein QXZ17_14700 [Nitrososphaerota archaeon]
MKYSCCHRKLGKRKENVYYEFAGFGKLCRYCLNNCVIENGKYVHVMLKTSEVAQCI